jgi:aryl-alcohol dehydrogenase-like predicted oxidoreductase
LSVSALGFGTYRVDDHTPEHREALTRALAAGCNLIDTSTNYTDGASESCIGVALEEADAQGGIRREETVVVSKIGYVQGRNLQLARERERAGDPFPEMVKISPGCWHCIHPLFLEDQLGRSLSRLKLDRLDVCLLHNPEYFLEDAHRQGTGGIESARRSFYAREEEVKRGRIGWYGVSSNTFGMPVSDPEATSLGRMLEAAREAASEAGLPPGDHHFAVAQLPMNLFEHSPLTVKKEGAAADLSTLAFARENGIGVLVNRPLNAFVQGELIRLADFRLDPPKTPLRETLKRVADLEKEFLEKIGGHLRLGSDGPKPESFFPWAGQLAGLVGKLGGYEHWQAIQEQQIQPHLFQVVSFLKSSLPVDQATTLRDWLDRYLPELGELLSAFRSECAARSQERSDRVKSRIDPALPPALRAESLSRKALHAVASAEGVTCVLNGMRHPLYVEDSMQILQWERLPAARELFGRL